MSTVSRTFSVDPPPDVVVPYLADFSHAETWDPGTVRCVRRGGGPVAVGAQWDNTSKLYGMSTELTYTLTELTDRRIVLVGENKTATSTERITVTPIGDGSEITYVNDTVFNGVARIFAPLVRLVFERIADEVVRRISDTLNEPLVDPVGAS